MNRKGFVDSWRAAHPDPVADEGLTWPAGRPRSDDSWNPRRDAPEDRIDQIWSAGPATVARQRARRRAGGPGVGHRGASVGLRPSGGGLDVRRHAGRAAGDGRARRRCSSRSAATLTVTYHAPGGAGERVRIVPAGGDPATDAIDSQGTPPGAPTDGSVDVPDRRARTRRLRRGADRRRRRRARSQDRSGCATSDAPPVLDTSRWRFDVGEPIDVSFTFGRANRFDWIGLYERGADPTVASYLTYRYTGAAVEGSVTFAGGGRRLAACRRVATPPTTC